MTPDGWIKTGGLVLFDDEGYIHIVGRIKNLIILSNGENASLESIEEPSNKLRDFLVKEVEVEGRKVIAIEILPRLATALGKSWKPISRISSARSTPSCRVHTKQ